MPAASPLLQRIVRTPALFVLIVSSITAGACRSSGGTTPAASPSLSPAANHPPQVRALCNPCTVAAGRTVTLNADAQDADGDTLTYAWTAPSADGPVPITVRVSDGKGGIASDVITITVTK